MPFIIADLSGCIYQLLYSSDASIEGFALHSSTPTASALHELAGVSEVWRLRAERTPVRGDAAAQDARAAAAIFSFDEYIDERREGKCNR